MSAEALKQIAGVLGVLFGMGALSAQTLEVFPAIELRYPTQTGVTYQLQSSADLGTWTPWGPLRFGNGAVVQDPVSALESSRTFRLVVQEVRDVSPLLAPIHQATGVPALGCAVVRSNRIVGLGVTGWRKWGVTNAPVTVEDRWHQGSLTKSMTATLAAMLVAEGRIRWNSTLAEVFPDFAPSMNAAWRTNTLEWLTANRGGAPGDLGPSGIWNQLWAFGGTPREARRFLLEKLTILAPASAPGTRYEYSNAGFALAGHMLEQVTGRAWEDLLTERLFRPLGMTSGGFGVPATPRYVDQPWGHQYSGGKMVPVEPGTSADNPPGIGPAGTVHCSVADLARYAAFHLQGRKSGTPLLGREVFVKLHTPLPDNSNYAHGWNAVDRSWAGSDKALTHTGSNLQWFAVIWMAPARDFAVVAVCNAAASSGTNPGANATDQAVGKMIQEFLQN